MNPDDYELDPDYDPGADLRFLLLFFAGVVLPAILYVTWSNLKVGVK